MSLFLQRPQVFVQAPIESLKYLQDQNDNENSFYFLYLGREEKVLRTIKSTIFPLDCTNICNYYLNYILKNIKSKYLFSSKIEIMTNWLKEAVYNFCNKIITTRDFRFIFTANIVENKNLNNQEKNKIYSTQNHSAFVVSEDYTWTDEFDSNTKKKFKKIKEKLKNNGEEIKLIEEDKTIENKKKIEKEKITEKISENNKFFLVNEKIINNDELNNNNKNNNLQNIEKINLIEKNRKKSGKQFFKKLLLFM